MPHKSVLKNYIYNTIYQIVLVAAPLITTPYLARVLGAEGIGTYSFSASIVTYFTLFATMGTAAYGQREISYVQDDREKRTEVFWNTEVFSCISTFICLVLYGVYVFFRFSDSIIIYTIFLLNIIIVVFDITWLFQGMEEFGTIMFRNIFFKLMNVVYIFVFIHNKDDLELYIFGMCLFPLLGMLSLWKGLNRIVDRPNWRRIHPFTNFKTILSLFIPFVAISIYTVLDKTMLGFFTDTKVENGYYEQALGLAKTVLTFVTALGTVVASRIGYHYEKQEMEIVRTYLYKSYRFVWFLGIPLTLGTICISTNLVPWFLGKGYDKVVPLLSVLSLLILVIGVSNVTGVQYLVPTKRQNYLTFTVAAGAVVNFTLNLLMIPYWFSIGAAVASVIAEMFIAVVQIIIIRKELSPWEIILSGRNYWIAGIIMFGILYGIGKYLDPSPFHSIIIILCGGIIYCFFLFILKDTFFAEQIKNLLQRFKNIKELT